MPAYYVGGECLRFYFEDVVAIKESVVLKKRKQKKNKPKKEKKGGLIDFIKGYDIYLLFVVIAILLLVYIYVFLL